MGKRPFPTLLGDGFDRKLSHRPIKNFQFGWIPNWKESVPATEPPFVFLD